MKCDISLSWRNGDEDLNLERTKSPDEVWGPPGTDWRNVQQAITVLDQTYADVRAAMISMLPKEVQETIPTVVKMTSEQARNFTGQA